MRTEKSRLWRSLSNVRDLMRPVRHLPLRGQAVNLNRVLQGHYASARGVKPKRCMAGLDDDLRYNVVLGLWLSFGTRRQVSKSLRQASLG